MLGDRRGTHFTTRDLKSIGFHFCDTLLDYYDPDPTKVRDKASCLVTIYTEMQTPSATQALSPSKKKKKVCPKVCPELVFKASVFFNSGVKICVCVCLTVFSVSSVLFMSDNLLFDRADSVVEKRGQREAGQRFGH